MTIQSQISFGEELRDRGMEVAKRHADRITPDWSGRIYEVFKGWLSRMPVGFKFLTEDFRLHIECQGIVESPPHKRAYGFLCPKAKREGLIEWAGTERTKDSSSHRTPANQWRKV